MSTQDGTYDAGKKAHAFVNPDGQPVTCAGGGPFAHGKHCLRTATALREAFEAGAASVRDGHQGWCGYRADHQRMAGERDTARADLASATARVEAAEQLAKEWKKLRREAYDLARKYGAERDEARVDAHSARALLKTARSRVGELVMVIECRPLAPETPEHVRERCSKEMDEAAVRGRMFLAALEAATPSSAPAGTAATSDDGKLTVEHLAPTCGHGIPRERCAVHSGDAPSAALTAVIEMAGWNKSPPVFPAPAGTAGPNDSPRAGAEPRRVPTDPRNSGGVSTDVGPNRGFDSLDGGRLAAGTGIQAGPLRAYVGWGVQCDRCLWHTGWLENKDEAEAMARRHVKAEHLVTPPAPVEQPAPCLHCAQPRDAIVHRPATDPTKWHFFAASAAPVTPGELTPRGPDPRNKDGHTEWCNTNFLMSPTDCNCKPAAAVPVEPKEPTT